MADEYRTVVLAALCFVSLAVAGAAISSTVLAENGGIETLADLQDEETGIAVENLSAPEEVQLGTNYTVSADVVNRNDSQRVQRVSYQIAGSVIATQLVEIPANNTTTVEFEVAGNETEGTGNGTAVTDSPEPQATSEPTETPLATDTQTQSEAADHQAPTPSDTPVPAAEDGGGGPLDVLDGLLDGLLAGGLPPGLAFFVGGLTVLVFVVGTTYVRARP